MSSYIQGFEDDVRATKTEYLKLLEEEVNSEEHDLGIAESIGFEKGTRMNALKLADELMKFYNLEENTAPIQIYDLAATMLRQQQAEIDALKMDIQSFY